MGIFFVQDFCITLVMAVGRDKEGKVAKMPCLVQFGFSLPLPSAHMPVGAAAATSRKQEITEGNRRQ